MIKPDFSVQVPENLGHIHFIGIGGSGMSGLARLAIGQGNPVSGSDVRDGPNIQQLLRLGARIKIGHEARNVEGADTVVVTSALWPNNPELLAARAAGVPIIHRSQLLSHYASSGRLIAVAGAHGKTTSTGMIITALERLGADASWVSGGVLSEFQVSAKFGSGELFVIEADESDSSFLHYDTNIALITNVDPDHLDHFGSLEAFEAEFRKFGEGASEFVVISADDPGAARVAAGLKHVKTITFGESALAHLRISDIDASGSRVTATVQYQGEAVHFELTIPGRHNAWNAGGAIAVLVGLGFPLRAASEAVSGYRGSERRFERHGEVGAVAVYDDFAHHPAEVRAALLAARAVAGSGRLITVFQPHLYSRTRLFANEFAESLSLSDEVVVTAIYGAREDPEPGVTGELITTAEGAGGRFHYVAEWSEVPAVACGLAKSGDFIITMGCGDIFKMVPDLLAQLELAST